MSAPTQQQGACLCQGITFTITGEPSKVLACYCYDCQKNAGGSSQISAKFPKSNITLTTGDSLLKTYTIKKTGSGKPKHKVFCSECGCTLWTIPMVYGGDDYMVRTSLIEGGLGRFKPETEFFPERKPGYLAGVEGL